MRVTCDFQTGIAIIASRNVTERDTLTRVLATVKPGEKLEYCGYSRAERYIKLYAGGVSVEEEIDEVAQNVFRGGVELTVRGDNEQDAHQVFTLRLVCARGPLTGGLLVVAPLNGLQNDETGIVVTGCYCTQCKKAMIDPVSCEWGVCPACAQSCQHEWETGLARSLAALEGVTRYCKHCGRVDGSAPVVPIPMAEGMVFPGVYSTRLLTAKDIDYFGRIANGDLN